MQKRDRGITLIALVITIIILLILAGITIATLTGDNGLFNRAKEAKQNTIDAQEYENATLGDYENKIDDISIDWDKTNEEFVFEYTGNVQEFIAPKTGKYKMECWGAQGGSYSSTITGGLGAYTSGKIKLEQGEKIYIYVGGAGKTGDSSGGYNGGGTGFTAQYPSGGGGGSTDIRTISVENDTSTSLKSRIMVAAGGGGSSWSTLSGGEAGAYNGYPGKIDGRLSQTGSKPEGGSQIAGGKCAYVSGWGTTPTNGTFGKGGIGAKPTKSSWCDGGGGGSGWYGGRRRWTWIYIQWGWRFFIYIRKTRLYRS